MSILFNKNNLEDVNLHQDIKSALFENYAYQNERILYGYSRMCCAMINQAIKDFLTLTEDEADALRAKRNELGKKDKKTKQRLPRAFHEKLKYWEEARNWLLGGDATLTLYECCSVINNRLMHDGRIESESEGLSVALVSDIVMRIDENDVIKARLNALQKAIYLCDTSGIMFEGRQAKVTLENFQYAFIDDTMAVAESFDETF